MRKNKNLIRYINKILLVKMNRIVFHFSIVYYKFLAIFCYSFRKFGILWKWNFIDLLMCCCEFIQNLKKFRIFIPCHIYSNFFEWNASLHWIFPRKWVYSIAIKVGTSESGTHLSFLVFVFESRKRKERK